VRGEILISAAQSTGDTFVAPAFLVESSTVTADLSTNPR